MMSFCPSTGVPDGMANVAPAPNAVMVYWFVVPEVGVIVPPAEPVIVVDVPRITLDAFKVVNDPAAAAVPPMAGGLARYVENPVPDTVLDALSVVNAPVFAAVEPIAGGLDRSSVPPRVRLPELVIVPDKLIPLTVPVPATEVTDPEPLPLNVLQSVLVK